MTPHTFDLYFFLFGGGFQGLISCINFEKGYMTISIGKYQLSVTYAVIYD